MFLRRRIALANIISLEHVREREYRIYTGVRSGRSSKNYSTKNIKYKKRSIISDAPLHRKTYCNIKVTHTATYAYSS